MVEARARNREHAIVLGGSIAGLFAARILSDYFQRVTIIERDPVHDEPESRKGQPQTRHLHGVLEPARRFIRTHLSDTEKCLLDGGALVGDFGEFARWYHFDDYKVHTTIGLEGMALSRPFLEWHVRRAVLALPNISLIDNAVAESFVTDANRSRIAGVNFTRRTGDETADTIEADLVVDACGRGSATPKWLAELGYPAPEEEEVKVRVGYATRVYRRSGDYVDNPKVLMISPTPPEGKRGAFLFPVEGDCWIVTAGGWIGDHPPADEAGFMEYVRSLPASDIYDVLSHSEPLSDIVTYKFPASRRLRYDKVARFPDGLFVIGDAVASFNPIYGQGMSSAAMQVEILNTVLKESASLPGWRDFFARTAKVIDMPWQLAVGEDFRYPETEGKRPIAIDLINQYVARVHRAVHHDPVVYAQFLQVMHLLAAPTSLMQPRIFFRVMRGKT